METPPRTAREMLERGRVFLQKKEVPGGRLDAELLVAHALGLDRLHLFLELDRPVAEEEIVRARELLVRRAQGEPAAYLTELREFYGRSFRVGPGVLVPRPETELLVDLARERARDLSPARIAEVGTGSGCIAITLALELEGAELYATELSQRALAYARQNAERLAADRGATLKLLHGDGLAPLAAASPEGFHWIVSNPPYVDPDASEFLEEGVRRFEPHEALFAPPGDPLHWVRRLIDEGRPLVRPGGGLLVELGFDQAPSVRELLEERGLEACFHADLAGVERVLELRV